MSAFKHVKLHPSHLVLIYVSLTPLATVARLCLGNVLRCKADHLVVFIVHVESVSYKLQLLILIIVLAGTPFDQRTHCELPILRRHVHHGSTYLLDKLGSSATSGRMCGPMPNKLQGSTP